MGAARSGRFGIVTNFRDLESAAGPDAPSRGDLVTRFLTGATSPKEYLDDLRGRAPRYAGFNLLLGGPRALYYFSNRDGLQARALERGPLRPQQPLARFALAEAAAHAHGSRNSSATERIEPEPSSRCWPIATPADDDEIPDTGLPPEWERALSAPFVVHERYGTRCSTLLLVERDGHTTMLERRFDAAGAQTGATRLEFDSMDVPERWFDNDTNPTQPTARSHGSSTRGPE